MSCRRPAMEVFFLVQCARAAPSQDSDDSDGGDGFNMLEPTTICTATSVYLQSHVTTKRTIINGMYIPNMYIVGHEGTSLRITYPRVLNPSFTRGNPEPLFFAATVGLAQS